MDANSRSAAAPEEKAIATLNRYLRLCDVPCTDGHGDLAEIFTEDAIWEGGGTEYGALFGRSEGRQQIVTMLAEHLPPNPHFRANVHLLQSGTTEVAGTTVRGTWLMQQLSTYQSGHSDITVARLTVTVDVDSDPARISRFRTERLFTAPLGTTAAQEVRR